MPEIQKPEYLSITFDMGVHHKEIWLAMLSDFPFEAFQEEEKQIIGYILQHDFLHSLVEFISENQGIRFDDYHLDRVPDKNWNEVWESSFNPVAVDDYCYIRAVFHPVEANFKHGITISPKMAFGTGHHATTYMMLQAMSHIDFKNKMVLDFGCGTSILGIVAAKEGARKIIGVDIQPEAIENSAEHAELNGVSEVCEFLMGGLEITPPGPYEVILANINRNVIIPSLPALKGMLTPGGLLLISGIMFDDEEVVTQPLKKEGLSIQSKNQKDNWLQLTVSN
ncbi:MAG: 50S ribosomal protein L11 methyltransferase [Bacteroidota bacterium]|nr:50S ribosomal protein L11 methyltransferase [Bacteroidota bacterium]